MSDTPRLGLPELAEAQAGKVFTINEVLRLLDSLVQPVAMAMDLNEAPSGPADGDVYVVGDSVTSGDDWADHEGNIAYYSSSAWIFIAPKDGWLIYDLDTASSYRFDGSATWVLQS